MAALYRDLHWGRGATFPVDKGTCSYQVLWNTFKRIATGHSADEKTALFSGSAAKAYRLIL